jgi:hypothetical protein
VFARADGDQRTGCRFTSCSARSFMTAPAIPMAMRRAGTGPTTTCASGGLPRPPPNWRQALWTRIGQQTWFTPMTGRPRLCRPTSPGTRSGSPPF